MNKELATRLLDMVQNLYIENLVLRRMLDRSRIPDWRHSLAMILAHPDPESLAQLRSRFDPLRALIQRDTHLEQVLQEFLQVAPAKKDVNQTRNANLPRQK